MATKKTVTLELLLKSAGIKPTTEQLKQLNSELQKTAGVSKKLSKEQNKTKRNLEGVAQRSGRAGKDFSRMAQGMGGLVQAYATIAANVFALSSAFLVLRRAADLSSMIKSSEDFSNRFGVSVVKITEHLQRATGGALSFADALPIVNKAISANIPVEKIEQLAIAATKASQTFGGSATEALNRFISAAQRGRVEIIQTLGIVIKTEKAYADYAATIGKTAIELSAFDRQQAILNATIEASQSVFDKVNIDPNPFQQLITTLTDLKNVGLTLITDFITPFINALNKSKDFALLLILAITKSVSSRIFPQLTALLSGFTAASIKSNVDATLALKKAQQLREKAIIEHTKTVGNLSERALRNQLRKEEESYAKRQKKHKSFLESIFRQDQSINAKILNQQKAAYSRQEKALISGTGKGVTQSLSTDVTEVRRQIDLRNRLAQATGALNTSEKQRQATAARTASFNKKLTASMLQYAASLKAVAIGLKSGIVTGFSKSFQTMQTNVSLGLKKLTLQWGVFLRSIDVEGKNSLKFFSEAFGRTVGTIAGFLTRAVSGIVSLVIWISLAKLAWDKYGDAIQGISKSQRAIIDATELFTENLEKANEVLATGVELWGDRAPASLKEFADAFQFLSGLFESITVESNKFTKALTQQLNNLTLDQAISRINELEKQIKAVQDSISSKPDFAFPDQELAAATFKMIKFEEATEKQRKELKQLQGAILALSEASIQPLLIQFANATEFSEKIGLELSGIGDRSSVAFKKLESAVGNSNAKLIEAGVATGGLSNLNTAVTTLFDNFKDSPQDLAVAKRALVDYFTSASGELTSLNRQAATSLKGLQEVSGNFNTFVLGLEKLRSQKSPFKDLFGFVLDTENALKDLIETQKDAGSTTIQQAFEAGDLKGDLTLITALIGDQNLNLEDTLELIEESKLKFQDQLETQILGTQKLKVAQLELKTIKDREIRTDQARLDQVRDITASQIGSNNLQLDLVESQITAQEELIAILEGAPGTSKSVIAQEKVKLSLYEAQRKSLNQQQKEVLRFTKYWLSFIDLNIKILKDRKAQLNILKQAAVINRNLVDTIGGRAILGEDIFIAQKALLQIEKDLVEQQKRKIRQITDEGPGQDRLLKIEEAKLLLLKQQTAQLVRQQESRRALDLERQGVTIFEEAGIERAVHFFGRELQKEVRKLKSTFEIIGRGFATVINDTFDTAVKNLLEGGEDFGHVIVETIKAGLRDVFGEALKSRIREAFALLFEGKTEDPNADLITSNETVVDSNTSLITAIDRLNATMSAPKTGVGEATKPVQENITSIISDTVNNGNKLSEVVETITAGNEITKLASEEAKGGLTRLIEIIVQFITTIGGGIGGAISSFFKFGLGGVTQGMQIPKLANGAVTTGPNLAVIGEGKNREAVVPLPNNREIPVDLKGASGDTISIEQNFDFRNADTSAIPQLRAEAKAIEERTIARIYNDINRGGRAAKIVGRR